MPQPDTPEGFPEIDLPDDLAIKMAVRSFLDVMHSVLEGSDEYRAEAIAHGYSVEIAEQMAADCHRSICAVLFVKKFNPDEYGEGDDAG